MEEELKKTKCKFCGTKKRPIFVMPKPKDKYSYYCKKCKEEGKE